MTVLILVSMFAVLAMGPETAAAAGMSPKMTLMGMAIYGAIAAWFITMGVGSILARRWARALILVSAWIWLACGISGIVFMSLFMGDMFDSMAASGQTPPGFAQAIKVTMVVFSAVFYVALPGSLVLFYRGEEVKATCEYRNPAPSWTDACPLPVLAHVLLFVTLALSMLLMGGYNWAVPFFGVILSGPAGAAAAIAIAALSAGLAWGACKLKPAALWGSAVLIVAWGASTLVTFARTDLMEFYEKMGMPPQQLDMMRPLIESGGLKMTMLIAIPLWMFALLALMAYTKRYYGGTDAPDPDLA
ncbi:MAG: hypothetical protein Q8N51_16270 [Gammaproteobacteria bacterium]|nr:hypothetical protein [Gammaproteobacteria bacterium]